MLAFALVRPSKVICSTTTTREKPQNLNGKHPPYCVYPKTSLYATVYNTYIAFAQVTHKHTTSV